MKKKKKKIPRNSSLRRDCDKSSLSKPSHRRRRWNFLCFIVLIFAQDHNRAWLWDVKKPARRMGGRRLYERRWKWRRNAAMPLYVAAALTGTYWRAYGRRLTLLTAFRQMRRFSLHDCSLQRAMGWIICVGVAKGLPSFARELVHQHQQCFVVQLCMFAWSHIGKNTLYCSIIWQ